MRKVLLGGFAGYPEAYFARLALPVEAVMAVVAACRSDDIYHQVLLLLGRHAYSKPMLPACG